MLHPGPNVTIAWRLHSKMRVRLLIMVLLALCVLVVFATIKTTGHKSTIKTYFNDARGLRAGAPVRVAGVEVGRVASVRVRDDLRDRPAEVVMVLRTSYELKIPSDAVVRLQSDGVLGQAYPEIDIRNAVGPPLPEAGTLKSEDTGAPSASDLLECLAGIVNHRGCNLERVPKAAPRQR